jgi:hypothetical protein
VGVLVAIVLVVLAGVGVAGGVSAAIVQTNQPDAQVQLENRTDPVVIDYGSK